VLPHHDRHHYRLSESGMRAWQTAAAGADVTLLCCHWRARAYHANTVYSCWPFVRSSATSRCSIKTAKHIITQTRRWASTPQRQRHHILVPQPFTTDVQNLNRSSVGASEYSLSVYQNCSSRS